MLVGQFVRIGVQGGYFILLARGLEARQFGAVAALLSVVALLVPFSSLGSGLLVVKNVSRDHSAAPVQWSNAATLTLLSGSVMAGIVTACSPIFTAGVIPLWAVAATAISDLVLARLLDAAAFLFQALGRMGTAAILPVLLHAGRLAALAAVALGTSLTASSWAVSYLAASILISAATTLYCVKHVGMTRPRLSLFAREWRTGALFSIGMSSQTIYNDIDKALLGKLSTLQATGTYAAAYRIVDMSYVPVRALIAAAYPDMMRAGAGGLRPVLAVVRRSIALPAAAYCLVGTIAMALGAGLVPVLLGDSYASSVTALRLLSSLLLLKGLHYIAGDALTTANEQGHRTLIQVSIAVLNVALCFLLIPTWGWHGAVAASLTSDGLLALCLWFIIWRRVRILQREPHSLTKQVAGDLAQRPGATVGQ
ncbi:O-antigen/teichoic acid export membrane protein [Phycicoccus sp. SLBN-51]|nr:O-antigen/teichoic acid export membrane protein [Phycicoccus sp. SLBN-51]